MNTERQTTAAGRKGISGYLITPLCVTIALLSGVATAEAGQAKIVGTWKANVHFVDCVSGQTTGEPFFALATYYADGNATEVPYAPPTARTASYGRWTKAGKNTYAASSQFGVFDVNGFYAGYQVLERMLVVSKDGQTFDIRARTDRYSVDDQILFSACAAGTGGKLPEPEPF